MNCESGETKENCPIDCEELVCNSSSSGSSGGSSSSSLSYWSDKIIYSLPDTWGNGGCGKISLTNSNTKLAKRFIISAKICNSENLKISSFWSGDFIDLGKLTPLI